MGVAQQRRALRCAGRVTIEEKSPSLVATAEALAHASHQQVQCRLRDGDLPGQKARPGRARVVALSDSAEARTSSTRATVSPSAQAEAASLSSQDSSSRGGRPTREAEPAGTVSGVTSCR